MKILQNLLIVLFAVNLFSCVPAKKFQELQNKQQTCSIDLEDEKNKNLLLSEKNNELEGKIDVLNDKYETLVADTSSLSKKLRMMRDRFKKMEESKQDLLNQLIGIQKGNAAETSALLKQIRKAQNDLRVREDEMLALERQMDDRKRKLDALQNELASRDQRLKELELALQQKDAAVLALKNSVMNALTGFEGNGLSIQTKNGKVYVSMDEKLLFRSGSYQIDQRGVEALNQLATVLSKNKDINVMIEGHTDNVPYNGRGALKDNWDLSTKRATSIVRVLIRNKEIDPQRLIVAGRSKYAPVESNDTAEGKSKNRRTEIILTPKLDELFRVLGN